MPQLNAQPRAVGNRRDRRRGHCYTGLSIGIAPSIGRPPERTDVTCKEIVSENRSGRGAGGVTVTGASSVVLPYLRQTALKFMTA
jgi:hypothetical protein